VTWNAMIRGYFQNGQFNKAVKLFNQMPERDIFSYNTVIAGLMQCGEVGGAREVFDGMVLRDVVTWNSMISGYIRNGLIDEALTVFNGMPSKDDISWNLVIGGLVNCQKLDLAEKYFKEMRIRSVASWSIMISGLAKNDHGEEGVKLFIRMKEAGPSPDEATVTSVLTICSSLPALHLGKQTHALAIKSSLDRFIAVSNAMVTMYARCGNMHSALLEFSSMLTHDDVISWNSIICGFAHHGYGEKALEMFEQMRLTDIKPNHITFVGVLSACSHAGLVNEGKHYFDYMKNKCFVQPTTEHYTCIVDLLGRFGLIDEAMRFLDQMKTDGIDVPASVWGALLGACRIHKNTEVGEIAGEKVLEMEPYNSGIYLILAEMHLSSGKRDDAERILARMKANGVKKQPGCSWIEVNNSGHVFLSGVGSHPEISRVCCVLNLLHIEM
ncbi:PPR domain-containing protein/PPR_2 domain-containing protein/PPR_3 domain-containing protein, partial [Cephalotus follicularis]